MSELSGIGQYTPTDIDKQERKRASEVLVEAKKLMATKDLVRVDILNGYMEVERHIYEANKEHYEKIAKTRIITQL